ncbi:hypothetical protein Q777_GL001903 [Lacticaseibacillus rhamnosus DSM 20021 = JCM 1136 = NBRC 3425]|nr:hypothetical protein Q777_GL001903 [Lacticaseibacillus rhamnosus DSM 20021 = JCM 1136 = NBRC 3425]CAR90803.1 Putative protein without homology [Lacticaseibacillus rhamnosus Lc 705]
MELTTPSTAAQKWQIAILSLSNVGDGYFLRLFSAVNTVTSTINVMKLSTT